MLQLLDAPSTPRACRRALLMALSGLKDDRVLRSVQRASEDADAYVRAGAVEWFSRRIRRSPGGPASGAAGSRPGGPLQGDRGIAEAGGPVGLRGASDLASEPEPFVRRAAIAALARLGEPA